MKTLKKVVLALCIAASMGAVSTSAMAEGDSGRITYAPADAIDMVAAKTGEAITAIEQGADATKVDGLIIAILAASKEINASDKVFAKRDKVHSKLKAARAHLKAGATQEAEQELRDAQKAFLALKEIL
jgi:tRNA A37 threonylcarbamoyladenosine synthetase subunit TsaC/SUA5/YrdC